VTRTSGWVAACAITGALLTAARDVGLSAVPDQAPTGGAAVPAVAPAERGFTMALTGDALITMKLSVHKEPQFLKMIDLIRGADVAFTNLEMLFHDYEAYPATESGGTYLRADPSILKELVWAGFDMVARANNHAGDYGVDGARLTTRHVADAGLVQAGWGESLREAREAKYFETEKGRVALISTSSTFSDQSRAGVSWGDTRARPGLNPLRFTTTQVLTRDQFDALRNALRAANLGGQGGRDSAEPVNEMTVFNRRIIVGDKAEIRTEPLKEDLDGMAIVVRNASRQADFTIVNSHTHEGGADRYTPPQFFVTFAHAMIDAGADVVTASGPHVLRGIEIYKGKAILYGLANFVFENETLLRQPPENYEPLGLTQNAGVGDFNDTRSKNDAIGFPADPYVWESVVAVARFTGEKLVELKLYPISLGFKKPRTQRGWPMLASPELAKKIIDDLVKFSAPFGTKIEPRDGVGIVSVSAAAGSQN